MVIVKSFQSLVLSFQCHVPSGQVFLCTSLKLIHFRNGCDRSGVFCAVSQVMDKIEKHSVIDAFNSVKEICKYRPEFISSLVSNTFESVTSESLASE